MTPEIHLQIISGFTEQARAELIQGESQKYVLEKFTTALDKQLSALVDDMGGQGYYFLSANRASLDLGLNYVEEE